MTVSRSGFAVIAGRPSVGKSTLLNRMIGRKISIVSDKVQTTRNRISGVLTKPPVQVVFIDTPGIHRPRHKLGEYMLAVAQRTLSEVDCVVFVVDGSGGPGPGDRYVADLLTRASSPVIVAVNKVDLLGRPAGRGPATVEGVVEAYSGLAPAKEVIPVSAVTGRNVERLIEVVSGLMPEGPMYYPEDMITDQPEQFIVKEIVREKILMFTREEVPHSVAVDIEEMVPRSDDLVYISATVYVERESQKGIVVGEGGRLLKEVGRLAREDIEALLGNRVYLDLWVKVKKDWRNRESVLRSFGYHPDA
ncbi:MAG: GTPase Era [Firmicutes bacterium]|nr:GTPase Era [Bacillota bacterium]